MTYVIGFGKLGDERRIECETATEALAVVTKIRAEGRTHLTVTHIETGDVALEVLQVLAKYETPRTAFGGR